MAEGNDTPDEKKTVEADENPATKGEVNEDEEEPETEPEPDPETCRGVAVGYQEFLDGVESGEWRDQGFLFYIEPEGILDGPLRCTRSEEEEPAGLVMTREAWKAHVVYLDDDVNPDKYELTYPREYGYVKSLQHYMESSRQHAKYPWTKKY